MASKRRPAVVEPTAAPDLDALRARVADLEASEAARQRSDRVQDALYRIAEAASAATDLQAFYRTIHDIVGELMFARNFYIALHDAERGRMNYPYYVDEYDLDPRIRMRGSHSGKGRLAASPPTRFARGDPC